MRTMLLLGIALFGTTACGGQSTATTSDGGIVTGGEIGSACKPIQENEPTFGGTNENEVSIEGPHSPQCGGNVCLENHFRGRVGCPYGQAANGTSCKTNDGNPVTAAVPAQCADRTADRAVYCSCRCAN